MQTSKLAQFFIRQREIIEEAELPFAKLAIFILPILAPLVPAVMTGLHMFKLLSEIFVFSGSEYVVIGLSIVVGLVLELLGYVGAISFIRAVFDLVRKGKDEYLLPAGLTGLAYLFYLVAMFMINVKLGEYFGEQKIVTQIVGMLSFVTVPTGLLAATHLSSKENKEEDRSMYLEKKDERLKKTALKNGINIFALDTPQAQPNRASNQGHADWRTLTPAQKREVITVLTVPEIMAKYGTAESTAFAWKKKEL